MATRFVGEIGSNHNRNWARTEALIRKAKEVGCWGVKFQLFKAEKLYAPEYAKTIYKMKERELPEKWLPKIAALCEVVKIRFGCTPFDLDAVDALAPWVDWLKVSSFDIRREALVKKCMNTGLPLMVSLGLARGRDIIRLDRWRRESGYPRSLTLLHCVSNYPTKLKDCHMHDGLARLMRLAGSGQIELPAVGWSDHTTTPAAIYSAICHGARVIECHLDDLILNTQVGKYEEGAEVGGMHCWLPTELSQVIDTVRMMEEADGKGLWEPEQDEDRFKWMADPEDGLRPLKEYRK